MADAFDRLEGRDSAQGDAFDNFPMEQESFGKSFARTALQVPQGLAEATGPGILANLWSFLGRGETELDIDELKRLRDIGEREGTPFDEQAYENAREQALAYIPTVSNIAREVESSTGIPLEPKNRLQRGLRFASTASKIIPKSNAAAPKGYTFRGANTGLPRPVLGAGVEGVRETLIEFGIPEPIADLASFAVIKPVSDTGGILKIGSSKKESGLTNRRYEKLEKPTEVSPSTINKINETTEKEFRDLTNKIIEKSPIKETHAALANDVAFKKKAMEGFKEVENLSATLPKTFNTKAIKSDLENIISKKKNEGLTPSEFDKSHNKFIEQYIKETPDKPFTAKELVKQYRKNNGQLTEAYEPGQSFAYNRAKREALLDYNRAIANIIENEFPGSDFSKLFKETNKRWADISNSEAISKFLDELFTGKTNYKKARQLFDKEGMTLPFKRAMGEEGFAKFETLLNDLLSTEKGSKLLTAAEQKGFGDLAKTAGAYILHPTAAKAKLGFDTLKGGYKKIFEMLLDKPQLAVTWDRGINAMKAGNFKAAEKEFSALKTQENSFDLREKSRIEALKKFNERIKNQAVSPEEIVQAKPKKAPIPSQETIDVKPPPANAQQAATQAFDTYGLTSFVEDAVYNGFVTKLEELQPYLEKSPTLARKVKAIEEELGKPIDLIIQDIGGVIEAKLPKAAPKPQNSSTQIDKIEYKPKEIPTPKQESIKSEPPRQKKISKKEEKTPKEKKSPEKKNPVAQQKEVPEALYTVEDFPTLKEAKDYLEGLENSLKKAPKSQKPRLEKDIENLKELVKIHEGREFRDNFNNKKTGNEPRDFKKSQRDLVKEIIDLRKKKKSIKGSTREARDMRNELETQIKENEKDFYKQKKSSLPDIKKRPRADISQKGLKTQKDFIINAVEKALKNPPNTEMITIEVPGDGVFKVWNIQDVLEEFKGKIKKDWPVKQLPKLKGS